MLRAGGWSLGASELLGLIGCGGHHTRPNNLPNPPPPKRPVEDHGVEKHGFDKNQNKLFLLFFVWLHIDRECCLI